MKRLFTQIAPAVLIAGLMITGCKGDEETEDPILVPDTTVIPAELMSPERDEQFTIGDEVSIEIKVNDEAISGLQLSIADTVYADYLIEESQTIVIPTDENTKLGWTNIQLSYVDAEGNNRVDNRKVVFFSNTAPVQKTAQIIETYPHAKTSYTQGLEFYEGHLFEGTGQYNQSILAEVDLTSGTKIREHALDGSIFGEGITILNDTIFQITYRSGICYVYDLSFNLIKTFNYEGQGWGLTNDGENLIMSNGDSEIVWRNPETFEIVKSIQVFDDERGQVNLNELELINGNLFVNIYTLNEIIEVDTATGRILTSIDCQALATAAAEAGNDVMNGIAYNPVTGKTYMTGKYWSKLFEVSFE